MAKIRNTTAAQELGERLRVLHDRAGQPAYRQIALELVERMGREHAPSDAQVRRAHHGLLDPGTTDYEVLAGLAAYYRVSVADLGPSAAAREEVIVDLRTGRISTLDDPIRPGHSPHLAPAA